MRTTLNLPIELINEALEVSHCKTKTMVILMALQNLIRQAKIKKLKEFRGKVKLPINLNELRKR